ncbi:MAG: MBL fold metallo-hydrolase [Candidatus Hodarchaeales archaeon]
MKIYETEKINIIRNIENETINDLRSIDLEWMEIEGFSEITNSKEEMKDLKLNKIILTIKQILWNDIEINTITWKSHLVYFVIILLKRQIIIIQEFSIIINKLIAIREVSSKNLPLIYYLVTKNEGKKKKIILKKWLGDLLNFLQDITPETISLEATIETYKQYFSENIDNYWDHYINCVQSLNDYPEYIEETLANTEDSELIAVLPWVTIDQKKEIVRYLLNKCLENLKKPISEENFYKEIRQYSLFDEFPPSLNIIQNKLKDIDPKPVNPNIFEKVPQQLIKEIAPKFVYSITNPETDPKIKIFFPGGKGIGHSAILIKTKFGTLLFDFGMSVVNNTIPSWYPLLDHVDGLFLSHAHLDHSGSIPLLLRNDRDLPIFGTSATKYLCSMLWKDSSRIISDNYKLERVKQSRKDTVLSQIVSPFNIDNALNNFHEIKTKETVSVLPNIEVTAYEASHLFGSVGYDINISGKRIFYTGDFNLEGTAIFPQIQFPTKDADTVIFDGTYYGRDSTTSETKSSTRQNLKKILKNSKRVLIPAFSIGRSQEMLYNLHKINAEKDWKIYVAGMASKVATILKLESRNIVLTSSVSEDQFEEKTIVIGGQGMLQGGLSRRLFEYSKEDPKTSVILCGYQAPSTFGFNLLEKHPYIKKNYQQEVYKVPVSGHTQGKQLDTFIDNLSGKKIMVHTPEGSYEGRKREDILIPSEITPATM